MRAFAMPLLLVPLGLAAAWASPEGLGGDFRAVMASGREAPDLRGEHRRPERAPSQTLGPQAPVISASSRKNPRFRSELMRQFTGTLW
jgi:hypothetical protein